MQQPANGIEALKKKKKICIYSLFGNCKKKKMGITYEGGFLFSEKFCAFLVINTINVAFI